MSKRCVNPSRGRKQSLFVLLHRNYRAHRANVRRTQRVSERDFIAAVSRPAWSPFLIPTPYAQFRGHCVDRRRRLRASSFWAPILSKGAIVVILE